MAINRVIGGIYRYTYNGPATSPMNQRGPWLVGRAYSFDGSHVSLEPVDGLPVTDARPPAGEQLATTRRGVTVHVNRIDGLLTTDDLWPKWLMAYRAQEDDATAERLDRLARERESVIRLVGSLMSAKGVDVGTGQHDRSTPWGQFVDDLRRREPEILHTVAHCFEHYYNPTPDALGKAAEWLLASPFSTPNKEK